MGKIKDLTGQRFGRLTVIKMVGKDSIGKILWLCQCDCGEECIIRGNSLRTGNTTSCGCYNKQRTRETNLIDLTGQNFGKWTVIKKSSRKTKNNGSIWIC